VRRIPRLYETVLRDHLRRNRQMAFVTGPRQSGKTTVTTALADKVLSWDVPADRATILKGPAAIAAAAGLDEIRHKPVVVALDELHKYRHWRDLLKGLFDGWERRGRFVVTGSSRLDAFRRGGDSLMGRYFGFRLHPLSVGELCHPTDGTSLVRAPKRLGDAPFSALLSHGGFPEPFVKRSRAFTRRWQATRVDQLLKEDLRDLTRIHEMAQIEVLALLLAQRSGQQLSFKNLAEDTGVSAVTAKEWALVLNALHLGFVVRPWSRRIARSLRKEPKFYLRDWSSIADAGARAETLAACHLLKAAETWTDMGLGKFEIFYVRDKDGREVDFLMVRDGEPWFLVEVKVGREPLSPALAHYAKVLGVRHAFQATMDMPYVQADCFDQDRPTVVPMRTFLAQMP
jgi:uncharacterized protein